MRKKILLAVALLSAFFIGCSDKGDSPDDNPLSPSTETAIDSAHYTVIFYSTFEGAADSIVEDVFRKTQAFIDSEKVRVLVCYKYGVEPDEDSGVHFTGKLAKPGQLVTFELTKDLDLNTIKKNARMAGDSVLLSDPGMLSSVLNYAADSLPAKNYILLLHGHGGGIDLNNDYPKELRIKSSTSKLRGQVSAAILYDEATDDYENGISEGLGMYDIKREIENSSIKHFKSIFFHNCVAGNMEFLSELYTLSDYMIVSEHSLYADEMLMVDFIKELHSEEASYQQIVKNYFAHTRPHWKIEYKDEGADGDLMLLKSSEMSSLFPVLKKMSKRLQTYLKSSAKHELVLDAIEETYIVEPDFLLFDMLDFANQLAESTKDSVFIDCSNELKAAFDKLILDKIETHNSEVQELSSFSLSFLMAFADYYNGKSFWDYTNKEAYEYTTFHKKTGWGDWLAINDYLFYTSSDDADGDEAEE